MKEIEWLNKIENILLKKKRNIIKRKIDAGELDSYMIDYIGSTETITNENMDLINTVFDELLSFIRNCQKEV